MARTWTGWGRKEDMKNKKYLLLQLFAEGEGGGAAGEPAGDDSGTGEGNIGASEPISFDDFLKDEKNQAEFDRRVQKAINTAVTNAQKKWTALTDSKVSEAEKLAQMTEEEKAKYRAEKAEKELADLRRQMSLGDMAKEARKILADEEISVPDEIVSNLISEEAEKTKATVQAFAKSFKDAVQAAVKEALRGEPPKKGTGSNGNITRAQIESIKDPAERQRLIAEHIDLFS